MLLAIANRPMDTNTTYTTGGDVSRFRRSSVPGRSQDQGDQSSDSLTRLANALVGRDKSAAEGSAQSVPTGPVVRVARGNTVTIVPVGAR